MPPISAEFLKKALARTAEAVDYDGGFEGAFIFAPPTLGGVILASEAPEGEDGWRLIGETFTGWREGEDDFLSFQLQYWG